MSTFEDDAAKMAIVRRFQQVATDYTASLERQKQLAEAQQRESAVQSEITARANDCYAAARLLGFDLIAALATSQSQQAEVSEAVTAPQAHTAQIISPAKSIREAVLELAKSAYPEPVRASTLQDEIEKQRGPLHFKTIGMSLYRLSREGLVRRKGQKDWFYVPPNERAKNPGDGTPG